MADGRTKSVAGVLGSAPWASRHWSTCISPAWTAINRGELGRGGGADSEFCSSSPAWSVAWGAGWESTFTPLLSSSLIVEVKSLLGESSNRTSSSLLLSLVLYSNLPPFTSNHFLYFLPVRATKPRSFVASIWNVIKPSSVLQNFKGDFCLTTSRIFSTPSEDADSLILSKYLFCSSSFKSSIFVISALFLNLSTSSMLSNSK